MISKTIAAALVAALLVSAGAVGAVAAAPGNAPDDAGSQADGGAGGAAPADATDGDRGLPVDLPAAVPDHVTEIHQRIGDFLAGSVDQLGDAVSGVVSNGGNGGQSDGA